MGHICTSFISTPPEMNTNAYYFPAVHFGWQLAAGRRRPAGSGLWREGSRGAAFFGRQAAAGQLLAARGGGGRAATRRQAVGARAPGGTVVGWGPATGRRIAHRGLGRSKQREMHRLQAIGGDTLPHIRSRCRCARLFTFSDCLVWLVEFEGQSISLYHSYLQGPFLIRLFQ